MNNASHEIENLSPESKRVLLQQALEGSESEVGFFPLSFAQQRIWLLEQLEGGSALYNIPQFYRLSGPLEVEKLEAALNEIVARHEVLRTSFVVIDGEPWQVIATSARLQLAVVEVGPGSAAEREAEVQRLARAEAQRPFDLERGPLLRASLLRLAEEEHVLLLNMHHIISDGWSLEIMRKELAALYEAGVKGESAGLAELEIQYGDYAVWQREWLQGAVLEEQLEYWRGQLAGVPAVLELPSDRVRPAVASHCGASYHFELSPEVSEGLRQLSRACGATLFMVLLAGFKMLLWRLSGQGDVVVGTPIAGRTRQEVEGLIGFFVNTLVLRTEVVGQLSFRELVERVRKVCVEAYAHQDVPFEKLVEELGVERELSRSPLFQVMFSLQSATNEDFTLADLTVNPMTMDQVTSKFDLMLVMGERSEGLSGIFEYSTDLFDRETIERMAGLFEQVLRAVVADREQLLWQVPLLSAGERRKQVEEWNATARDYAELSGLQELFERQAAASPNAVAVRHEAGEVSYGELNERANELAGYLRSEYGVGPEVLVGLMVERGLEMVVGILGILKAGGAYLPLDPQYPVGRLRYMLEDGGAQLLLTQQALLTKVGELKMPVVCLDSQWPERVVASEPQHGSTAGSSNLAYVIYTSGSTGQPKGVGITHASALVMVQWAREIYPAAALSGVLASTSICFDLSVFELFVPLSWGGSVILAETALALPRLRFADAVTLVNTVPSVMAELLRTEGLPAAVRIVNLAGEALHRQLVEAVYQQPQVEQVWNLYGPTEDTTYSTYALVPRGEMAEPVIGRPLANTQVYILDEGLGVVPVGVAGEIYLGGAGLARGYLGRPALTAERFVPDPYSASAGARLYRTGDRGRYQADGQIQYLGRADQQIKLRGFRIELGEIEAALTDHPAVREAVVIARPDANGEIRLIGYVENSSQEKVPDDELRRFLREKLPDYMVPALFMQLTALPRTLNGKVNREALPEPQVVAVTGGNEEEAELTPTEELVAGIWSELLKVEKIGVNDNFFGLGGHSLLATRVLSRVHELFQVEIPLRHIFADPTVAGLAQCIERSIREGQGAEMLPVERISREGELPLSFNQEGRLFREWWDGMRSIQSPAFHLHIGFHLTGPLNISALERAFNEIVRRHEVLRTTFTKVKGILSVRALSPILSRVLATKAVQKRLRKLGKSKSVKSNLFGQAIVSEMKLKLHLEDLRNVSEENRNAEALRIATEEVERPFDYATGPLLRVSVLRVGDEEHILSLGVHHLVSDGGSLQIIMREVVMLYEAFCKGQPSPLTDLAIQYVDFAHWQRERLQGEFMEKIISYWEGQFDGVGIMPHLELPFARPQPKIPTFRGETQMAILSPDLSKSLRDLGNRNNVTLYMVFLAALKTLLHRYTGRERIGLFTPFANRNRAETQALIGWFSNMQVLTTNLSGDPRFSDFLVQVREVVLGAYAHHEIPFTLLFSSLIQRLENYEMPRKVFEVPYVKFDLRVQNDELPRMHDVTMKPIPIPYFGAENSITVLVFQQAEKLRLTINYSTDTFDDASISRMLEDFQRLLQSITTNPDARLSELTIGS